MMSKSQLMKGSEIAFPKTKIKLHDDCNKGGVVLTFNLSGYPLLELNSNIAVKGV